MATGDYPFAKFIEISQELRSQIKPDTVMIANIGDFDYDEGKRLLTAGYTGIYHAIRMGEGRDTQLDPDMRMNTIKAAREVHPTFSDSFLQKSYNVRHRPLFSKFSEENFAVIDGKSSEIGGQSSEI